MELEFKVDSEAIEKSLRIMIARIVRFPYTMGAEMSEWQTDDMHRKRPYTKRSVRAGLVSTRVRPHSLKRMKKSRKFQRRLRRHALFPTLISTRPVLRPVLVDKLAERMGEVMEQRLQWQGGNSSESTDGS